MSSLWRNQLMFNHTQRPAAIQQGSAATQLMFNHTQRSAPTTLETGLQSSQVVSQPPLGQWLLFLDTLLKIILHLTWYTRRTPVAPVYAATLRHSIGSSTPPCSPSCLKARHFHLWRVHSIGHFHNNAAGAAWKKTNYTTLMLLFPICFSCYRLRPTPWIDNAGQPLHKSQHRKEPS